MNDATESTTDCPYCQRGYPHTESVHRRALREVRKMRGGSLGEWLLAIVLVAGVVIMIGLGYL